VKLVYVDLPVIAVQRTALMVADEADLKQQLAEREKQFKALPYETKTVKDKGGKTEYHQLSPEWD
jgi:hypothetical protein